MLSVRCFLLTAALALLFTMDRACAADSVDVSKLPPPATAKVEFDRDIWPIFEATCLRCHGREKPKGDYRLDSRAAALKPGDSGPAIIPGDSAKSPLVHYVARLVMDMEMPPAGKGDPLTREQVALVRAWIDQGAVWGAGADAPSLTITPTLRYLSVSGDRQKFRELTGQRGGWSGGFEDFQLSLRTNDTDITITGHVLADEGDAGLQFSVRRSGLGFVRGGVEQFRRYSDNSGGYSSVIVPPQLSLDEELHLDVGRAWIDLGLTLPDWPKLTVGYEYQWREGDKSLLQWGLYFDGNDGRNLAPAVKHIDERVHIVKFDFDHTIAGWRVEDSFRGEFLDLQTTRSNTTLLFPPDPAFNSAVTVRERQKSFTGANVFRVEKQLTDWLFVSGGHLYSKLDADAEFALDGQRVPGFTEAWRSSAIVLQREAHVFNVNAVVNPWKHFTLALGGQVEWARQEGMTGLDVAQVSPTPGLASVTINSDLDTTRVQESALLRYTGISNVTLFADARLEQERVSQFEEQPGAGDLLRDTDASSDKWDLRAGFNASPCRAATWSAHYRRVERDSDYDHLQDVEFGSPDGYAAFIRARTTTTDEVETRVSLRPVSWLRASLSYKLEATDYRTTTDPIGGGVTSGAEVLAGNYDAHNWGASLTFTGVRGLHLSTSFNYQHARTLTEQQGNPSVVPYRGDVYSVLASGTYALSAKVDLFASYAFSCAGFRQSNDADGLPVGIDYTQHTAQGGFTWRWNKHLRSRLGYGHYRYDEPTSGGLNNFTAHMVFSSLTYAMP